MERVGVSCGGYATSGLADVRSHDCTFVSGSGRKLNRVFSAEVLLANKDRRRASFEALHIPTYANIEAISRDGTRPFIWRSDSAIDC